MLRLGEGRRARGAAEAPSCFLPPRLVASLPRRPHLDTSPPLLPRNSGPSWNVGQGRRRVGRQAGRHAAAGRLPLGRTAFTVDAFTNKHSTHLESTERLQLCRCTIMVMVYRLCATRILLQIPQNAQVRCSRKTARPTPHLLESPRTKHPKPRPRQYYGLQRWSRDT